PWRGPSTQLFGSSSLSARPPVTGAVARHSPRHGHKKRLPCEREVRKAQLTLIFQTATGGLPDLAPCPRRAGCQGFIGPIPPPLCIRAQASSIFAADYSIGPGGRQPIADCGLRIADWDQGRTRSRCFVRAPISVG